MTKDEVIVKWTEIMGLIRKEPDLRMWTTILRDAANLLEEKARIEEKKHKGVNHD